jgi:hypothetical protein
MKTLERDRRTRREANPNLEHLDDRIVPSTMHVAAAAGAEAVAAVSGVQRHENQLVLLEMRQATHAISVVQRHENHLALLEARHEKQVARLVLRRARREARYLANHPHAIKPTMDPSAFGTLPANVSEELQSLYTQYQSYVSSGDSGTFSPTGVNQLVISGTDVGIMVKDNDSADFNTLITELQSDGMQILDSDFTYGLIEGMLPIAQLPTIAQLPQTLSVVPMFNPIVEFAR